MLLRWCLPIVTYHRVGVSRGDHVPTVSAETFEWQLSFLARHQFHTIAFDTLLEAIACRTPVPRRTVLITFDDSYEETYSVAAPLLHRFGFRATVFVPPFDIGRAHMMTWNQLRELSQNGMAVGSHTLSHAYLPLASQERIREELMQSKAVLEQELQRPIRWLSYPVGGFTPFAQAVAREAGYQAACTTNRGLTKAVHDLFALRRIKITERDRHPLIFSAKLSGYYDYFRRLEQPA